MAEDAEALRVQLADHWTELQKAADEGGSVDVAQAEDMHLALFTALDRWDALTEQQRATLRDTVAYVVDVGDAESDATSTHGLEDDLHVVREALRTVAPDVTV